MLHIQHIAWQIADVPDEVAEFIEKLNAPLQIFARYDNGEWRLCVQGHVAELDATDDEFWAKFEPGLQQKYAEMESEWGSTFGQYDGQYNFEGLTQDEATANEIVKVYAEVQEKLYPNIMVEYLICQ